MNEKLIIKKNEIQRQVDEIINLSSLLDVCVNESRDEKFNYLDVDLILKTPISNISNTKKSHVSHAKQQTSHSHPKVHPHEKNHEIIHPRRENLIHFHAHLENKSVLNNIFYSVFQFIKYS